MAAFRLAFELGADGIELDTKLTRDGHVVVLHDARAERTTDGSGYVSRKNLSEVRALDAGIRFGRQFLGEKIPTLEEVLAAIPPKGLLNIEVANYSTPSDGLARAVGRLVQDSGIAEQVTFSSFLPGNLSACRQLLPRVPRGLLVPPGWAGAWARSFGFMLGDYQALHLPARDVNLRRVARVHRLHRRLHVWTVNSSDDVARMVALGADGVFTDDVSSALRAVGRIA